MSTTFVSEGPTLEQLQQIISELQSQVDRLANAAGQDGTTDVVITKSKPLSKKDKKFLKALEEQEAQQAKELKKAKKQAKVAKIKAKAKKAKAKKKAKKAKSKKGWRRVARVTGAAAVGAGVVKASRGIARGARRLSRGSRSVGRKMWLAAIGGGKWAWAKMGLAGQKIAAAGAWALQGGARLVQWGLGSIGWGWALVGAAGIIVIGLVGWGVASGTEALSAPAAWVAAGRPGTLKKFKAKRNGKDLKKRSKALKEAKKVASKRVSIIDKELAKTQRQLAKLNGSPKHKAVKAPQAEAKVETEVEVEAPELKASDVEVAAQKSIIPPEVKKLLDEEMADSELVRKVAPGKYKEAGLDLIDVVKGLQIRADRMDAAQVPKDIWSENYGRYCAALAILDEDEELRGKPLYQKLVDELVQVHGAQGKTPEEKRKLAGEVINWTKLQSGHGKEHENLRAAGLDRLAETAAAKS